MLRLWVAAAAIAAITVRGTAAFCRPAPCKCDEENLIVVCNGTSIIEEVPITFNPGIRELRITYTKLKLVVAALDLYKELEYLDMSHNQLEHVETCSFTNQERLKVLKLGHNPINTIVNDTFAGMMSLTRLYLDSNALVALPAKAFVSLTSLQELDLSNNRIASIHKEAFVGLKSLRILRLRGNRLAQVPTPALVPVAELTTLDLGDNPLMTVGASSFVPVSQLRRLALDGCGLHELSEDSLAGLSDLRVLRLHNNALPSLPPAMAKLEHLEELHIGQNRLQEIPAHAFKGLRYLRVLEVSGSPYLEAVRKYAFSSNTDLETVRLVHNPRLSLLEAGAFEGLSSLHHVSLRGNAFASFSESLLPWDQLDSLDLRDNPVLCNCSILWLRNLLKGRNLSLTQHGTGLGSTTVPTRSSSSSFFADEGIASPVAGAGIEVEAGLLQQARPTVVATCASPSRLRGRNLAELDGDELSCYFASVRQQAMVGIVIGAVVACVGTLVLVVFKHRKRMTTVLKDKWSDGALRRKEHPHYHKTCDDEENNILHAAQQTLKLTPVTEL